MDDYRLDEEFKNDLGFLYCCHVSDGLPAVLELVPTQIVHTWQVEEQIICANTGCRVWQNQGVTRKGSHFHLAPAQGGPSSCSSRSAWSAVARRSSLFARGGSAVWTALAAPAPTCAQQALPPAPTCRAAARHAICRKCTQPTTGMHAGCAPVSGSSARRLVHGCSTVRASA